MSSTNASFAQLGVPAPLIASLAAGGVTDPFPIQTDTLPDTLAGRDVLGRGRTGSGKTIAFALPLIARLAGELAGGPRRAGHPVGLVLAPTRELATQINATLAPLAAVYGMTTTTIFGGVNQSRQVSALRAGVDIVVACPGRLEDLMQQGAAHLDAVEITVIDEADHMADLGFLPGVTRILSKTPKDGQRLLFSATLDNGVDKLVQRFLTNPVMHSVDDETSPVETMTHHVFSVSGADAKKDLVHVLASGKGRRILFLRTKHHAKKLAQQLTASGIPAVDLHGNLSQNARDRNLAAFSAGDVRVLVATDVAARGVHVDSVELVVHVDPPTEHKAYLHRSGRTARAGSDGDVVTVVLPEQRRDVEAMLRKADISARPQQVTPDSAEVVHLVGDPAAYVKPAPVAAQAAPSGGGQRSGAASGSGRRRGRQSGSGQSAPGQGAASQSGSGQSGSGQPGRSGSSGGRRPMRVGDSVAGRGGAAGFSTRSTAGNRRRGR